MNINVRMRTICIRSYSKWQLCKKQRQLSVGEQMERKSTFVQHFGKLSKDRD